MQNLKLVCLLLAITLVSACSSDESQEIKEGKITFSVADLKGGTGGRAEVVSTVMVTIVDANGVLVKDREELESTPFGDGFVTLPINLPEGNYSLTEFMVLDENGAVVYATPVSGSDLDYLVTNPLPIDFTIVANETTDLSPEVIDVTASLPEQYGYNGFNFTVVETFDFLFTVMELNTGSGQYEAVAADFTILGDGNAVTSKSYGAGTNTLKLRSDVTMYSFEITTANSSETIEYATSDMLDHTIETGQPQQILLGEVSPCGVCDTSIGNFCAINAHGELICFSPCFGPDNDCPVGCETHPDGMEYCSYDNDNDGIDIYNDCDDTDIGLGEGVIYYLDLDGDGYGFGGSFVGCIVPAGYVTNNLDCDDLNPSVNPGALEICGNGVDEDCDGQIDNGCSSGGADLDNDGFTVENGDCDDLNDTVYPDAIETCGDGIDSNCNGDDCT